MKATHSPRTCGRDVFARIREPVSPPPTRKLRMAKQVVQVPSISEPAAVEAGTMISDDHLAYFSRHLADFTKTHLPRPHLPIAEYQDLFRRNQSEYGRHFVIHQHDHPVAGTHYDLRLQINHCSSVSWAIMYGLPGGPNSRRLNRNATETRVHCLWNHLIETGSHATGSILIWDTGEYEVLPYEQEPQGYQTEDDDEELATSCSLHIDSEPQKLHESFRQGKIRVRLNGTQLPKNYTLVLRLSPSKHLPRSAPSKPARKRRRVRPSRTKLEDSEDDTPQESNAATGVHSDDEEDTNIRLNNAYTGSINTIGSLHQRKWHLSMDRVSSGFVKRKADGKVTWQPQDTAGGIQGFEPFYVKGRDVEKSIVTGRLAAEVLADEGVEGYVGRQGWRAVVE